MKRRIVKKQLKRFLKKARRVTMKFGPADEMFVTVGERKHILQFMEKAIRPIADHLLWDIDFPSSQEKIECNVDYSKLYGGPFAGLNVLSATSAEQLQALAHATDDAQEMFDEDIEITIL